MADGMYPPYWGANQANVVGIFDGEDHLTDDQEWYETVEALWPTDLYEAQRALRLGLEYSQPADDVDSGDPDTAADSDEAKACGCTSRGGAALNWMWLMGALGVLRRRSPACGAEVLR